LIAICNNSAELPREVLPRADPRNRSLSSLSATALGCRKAQCADRVGSYLGARIWESFHLRRQLYQGLCQATVSGQIPSESRLPSSRALADGLHLSRMPVLQAFQHARQIPGHTPERADTFRATRALSDVALQIYTKDRWHDSRWMEPHLAA
jgi:hypothetical protein